MSILTLQEAEDILKIDAASNFPQIYFLLPAVDDFIKTATGKDWGSDSVVDPLAKMVASVLLVRWFTDPGMIGKVSDTGLISLFGQLHAKAISGVSAP